MKTLKTSSHRAHLPSPQPEKTLGSLGHKKVVALAQTSKAPSGNKELNPLAQAVLTLLEPIGHVVYITLMLGMLFWTTNEKRKFYFGNE